MLVLNFGLFEKYLGISNRFRKWLRYHLLAVTINRAFIGFLCNFGCQ